MIIEKLHNQSEFTESEKYIAEYILNHREEIQRLTARELASLTHTSKSSIVRLCKKLEVDGYQDLKKMIYVEDSKELNKYTAPGKIVLDQNSTYSDYLNHLDSLYMSVFMKMHEQLNPNTMKRIINQLNRMERIEFYSTGLGYSIGLATAHKYSGLGIESTAYSSINEGFLAASQNQSRTAAIVISLSGKNPSVIHMAKILKKYGVYVVGVVGNHSKEIKEQCDEIVTMINEEGTPRTAHSALLLSANYIFDLFFMGLLAIRYDKQKDLYEKITEY